MRAGGSEVKLSIDRSPPEIARPARESAGFGITDLFLPNLCDMQFLEPVASVD
jgi:hypothetical protein